MAAGFVYNLKPKEELEERYDVSTGIRRRGNYILDVTGLAVDSYIPSFLPVAADLKAKTAKIAVRAQVAETADAAATKIKIAKNPYITDGMTLGNGTKGAVVKSVDRTNEDYDEVTLVAALGAKVNVNDTLFEASAASGTAPKAVANSALYETHKVTKGINSVALLMRAFEIEPEKLAMPFCAADKANLPYFQFNE